MASCGSRILQERLSHEAVAYPDGPVARIAADRLPQHRHRVLGLAEQELAKSGLLVCEDGVRVGGYHLLVGRHRVREAVLRSQDEGAQHGESRWSGTRRSAAARSSAARLTLPGRSSRRFKTSVEQDVREADHGRGGVRCEAQRLFVERARVLNPLLVPAFRQQRPGPQHQVEGVRVRRTLPQAAVSLGGDQPRAERAGDAAHDVGLPEGEVGDVLVEAVGPEFGPRFRRYELRVDADAFPVPPDAALHRVAHAELAPDLPQVHRAAPVGGSRAAGDDQSAIDGR